MERDSGFWSHHRHALLSPNLNLSGFPYDIGWLKTEPVLKNLCSVEDFHQTLAPVLNSVSKENLLAGSVDFKQKEESSILDVAPTQKRFLVFDQSGGKTTLIYSSGFRSPVQCGTCLMPKPHITYNDNNITKGDLHPPRPIINKVHEENNSQDDMADESEMREDSEELDALLYSDSDGDFSEEDEETSTGHSPSTMIDNGTHDFVEETGEEVDNFAGPNKRQKLLHGFYCATPQKEARSSVKAKFSGLEGEAESTCRNSNWPSTEGIASLSGMKRKERIHETLSIMQSIFPSLNGKGAIDAIDEAIHYLRSLKMNAKALGLDTL